MQKTTKSSAATPPEPTDIGILLFPEFSNLCLANAVEPLRAANSLARRPLYRWHFLGMQSGTIHSSSKLPVHIDTRLSAYGGGDILLVMPSYGHLAHATPATLAALRACAPRNQMMVGLDTGSWLLGAAGLLDGYKATSHWDILRSLAERFPNIDVVEDRYVIDRNRASCGGATTTLDLMLALIGQAHGTALALNVAALFMHGERDPKLDPLARLPDERILRAAAALMRRHIEQPLTLAEIAQRLHMDQRRLQRICREKAGMTPAQLYRSIRLAEAQRWLAQSRISVAEVAYRCGYGDATAMTRAFRQRLGQSPSQYRRSLAP